MYKILYYHTDIINSEMNLKVFYKPFKNKKRAKKQIKEFNDIGYGNCFIVKIII